MKILILDAQTKVLKSYMDDESVPPHWTAESFAQSYCKNNNCDSSAIVAVVDNDISLDGNWPEQVIYDQTSRSFAPNPNYVPPPPPERRWGLEAVRKGMSLLEKSKWDNNVTDSIKTAKIEFETPRLLQDTTEILQFLVDSGDISEATMNKVLL